MEGLDYKVNGQALGAVLRHSLGGLDGREQTKGVSESAAVAAGSESATCLLEEKIATWAYLPCCTDLVLESKMFKCFVHLGQ